jgi:HAMP domain-containing protein
VAAAVAAAAGLAPRETAAGPATGSSIVVRDNGKGYLAVALDPNRLDKDVRDLMIAGLSVIVVLSALAAGLAALLVRRLARPLIALVQATRDLEAGTYDPAVLEDAAARGDEVGVLARRFDHMADQVQRRQRALEQRVAVLEVEIDHVQREQSVQRITGSQSFADIQARAARLRERRSGLEERASVRPQDTEEGRG